MITISLADGGKVLIYDDAIQMPAELYKEFQKYLLQDSGIGSTMDDVQLRYATLFKQIAAGNMKEIMLEAENLFYTHYSIIEKIDFRHLAFGCLIQSIDGCTITDYSAQGITAALAGLSKRGLTQEELTNQVLDSKKNSNPN